MILQGFDPVEKTMDEFVEFCERLEVTEEWHEAHHGKDNGKLHGENPSKRKRGDPKLGTASEKRTAKQYECLYHGPNGTHGTHDCLVLKAQASKMAAAHANAGHQNKKARYGNKTWQRPTEAADRKQKDKGEIHAFVEQAVQEAMKKMRAKRKVAEVSVEEAEDFNYGSLTPEDFAELNLSDSD